MRTPENRTAASAALVEKYTAWIDAVHAARAKQLEADRLALDAKAAALAAERAAHAFNAALEAECTERRCAPGQTVNLWGDGATVAAKDAAPPPVEFEFLTTE